MGGGREWEVGGVVVKQEGQLCESSSLNEVVAGGRGKAKDNLVLFFFLKRRFYTLVGAEGKVGKEERVGSQWGTEACPVAVLGPPCGQDVAYGAGANSFAVRRARAGGGQLQRKESRLPWLLPPPTETVREAFPRGREAAGRGCLGR